MFGDVAQQGSLFFADLRKTLVGTIEKSQKQINAVLYAVAFLLGLHALVFLVHCLFGVFRVVSDDSTWYGPQKQIVLRSEVPFLRQVLTSVRIGYWENIVKDVSCAFNREPSHVERLVHRPVADTDVSTDIKNWWTLPPLVSSYEGLIHEGDMIGVVWKEGMEPASECSEYKQNSCMWRRVRFSRRIRRLCIGSCAVVTPALLLWVFYEFSRHRAQRQYILVAVESSFVLISDVGFCPLKIRYRANQLETWQVIDFVLRSEADPKIEYLLGSKGAEATVESDKEQARTLKDHMTRWLAHIFPRSLTDCEDQFEVNLVDQRELITTIRTSADKWPGTTDKYYVEASCWQNGLKGGDVISERTTSFYFRPPNLRVLKPTAGERHDPDNQLQVVWRYDVTPHVPLKEKWEVTICGTPCWSFLLFDSDAAARVRGDANHTKEQRDSRAVSTRTTYSSEDCSATIQEDTTAFGAISTLTVHLRDAPYARRLPYCMYMSRNAYIKVERKVYKNSHWMVAEKECSAYFVTKHESAKPNSDQRQREPPFRSAMEIESTSVVETSFGAAKTEPVLPRRSLFQSIRTSPSLVSRVGSSSRLESSSAVRAPLVTEPLARDASSTHRVAESTSRQRVDVQDDASTAPKHTTSRDLTCPQTRRIRTT